MTAGDVEPAEVEKPRWSPGRAALLAVLTLVSAYVIGQVVGVVLALIVVITGREPAGWLITVLAVLGTAITALIILRVGSSQFGLRPRGGFGLVRPRPWPAAGWTVLALAVALGVQFGWGLLVDQPTEDAADALIRGGTVSKVVAVLALVAVVPVLEEIVFRGFLFGVLARWRGPWIAAVLSSVVFALAHLVSSPPTALVPLFVLGVVLCLLYRLTGSLLAPVAVHVAQNGPAAYESTGWPGWTVPVIMVGGVVLALAVLIPLCRTPAVAGTLPTEPALRT